MSRDIWGYVGMLVVGRCTIPSHDYYYDYYYCDFIRNMIIFLPKIYNAGDLLTSIHSIGIRSHCIVTLKHLLRSILFAIFLCHMTACKCMLDALRHCIIYFLYTMACSMYTEYIENIENITYPTPDHEDGESS